MNPLKLSARATTAWVGAAALALVVTGAIMAHTMNLAACPLCILQRLIYLLIAAVALLAWPLGKAAARAAAAVMALVADAGIVAAGYQVWLQRFSPGVSCTAEQPWWERIVTWAGTQWPAMFEATGFCDEKGWTFLSLSIADWSLLIFAGMSAWLLHAALRRPR